MEGESVAVYIAPGAFVLGDVRMGEDVNVWYSAVIRADKEPITIGKASNIQDGCVLHVDKGFPMTIGENVTVGHGAILHGCTVGDGSLIGMGAIVLNGAVIGKGCMIGAGALVTQGAVIPDGSVAMGSPAKVKRPITPQEAEGILKNAAAYAEEAREQLPVK